MAQHFGIMRKDALDVSIKTFAKSQEFTVL
jgi:hypothetical protein